MHVLSYPAPVLWVFSSALNSGPLGCEKPRALMDDSHTGSDNREPGINYWVPLTRKIQVPVR